MAGTDEEEAQEVEASLDELIAKKSDRPSSTDDDEDETLLNLNRDEARESLNTKVLPIQQNEFVCNGCYLVKHRSQLADARRGLCRDCA